MHHSHFGFLVDEQVGGQIAVRHSSPNGDGIRIVADADTTRADSDDGKHFGVFLRLPEVVHAVTNMHVRASPAVLAKMVTDEHVQVARCIELEAEHAPKLDGMCRTDFIRERPSDAGDVIQLAVHADYDVGGVFGRRNVTNLDVFDHDLPPCLGSGEEYNSISYWSI
mgnify:CR=1 FL=1